MNRHYVQKKEINNIFDIDAHRFYSIKLRYRLLQKGCKKFRSKNNFEKDVENNIDDNPLKPCDFK